jgi:hypothetical protein
MTTIRSALDRALNNDVLPLLSSIERRLGAIHEVPPKTTAEALALIGWLHAMHGELIRAHKRLSTLIGPAKRT